MRLALHLGVVFALVGCSAQETTCTSSSLIRSYGDGYGPSSSSSHVYGSSSSYNSTASTSTTSSTSTSYTTNTTLSSTSTTSSETTTSSTLFTITNSSTITQSSTSSDATITQSSTSTPITNSSTSSTPPPTFCPVPTPASVTTPYWAQVTEDCYRGANFIENWTNRRRLISSEGPNGTFTCGTSTVGEAYSSINIIHDLRKIIFGDEEFGEFSPYANMTFARQPASFSFSLNCINTQNRYNGAEQLPIWTAIGASMTVAPGTTFDIVLGSRCLDPSSGIPTSMRLPASEGLTSTSGFTGTNQNYYIMFQTFITRFPSTAPQILSHLSYISIENITSPSTSIRMGVLALHCNPPPRPTTTSSSSSTSTTFTPTICPTCIPSTPTPRPAWATPTHCSSALVIEDFSSRARLIRAETANPPSTYGTNLLSETYATFNISHTLISPRNAVLTLTSTPASLYTGFGCFPAWNRYGFLVITARIQPGTTFRLDFYRSCAGDETSRRISMTAPEDFGWRFDGLDRTYSVFLDHVHRRNRGLRVMDGLSWVGISDLRNTDGLEMQGVELFCRAFPAWE